MMHHTYIYISIYKLSNAPDCRENAYLSMCFHTEAFGLKPPKRNVSFAFIVGISGGDPPRGHGVRNLETDGRYLMAASVVGLALEMLCKAEAEHDMSVVSLEHCEAVSFWYTRKLLRNGIWSEPSTCKVPLLQVHQRLTFCMWQKLYGWIAGLSLVVSDAVAPTSHVEGEGHHDLVLKHGGAKGPFYCTGFISAELQVSSVGPRGARLCESMGRRQR